MYKLMFCMMLCIPGIMYSQDSLNKKHKLLFDLPLLDIPYLADAGFDLKSYQSPSMEQALSVTHGLHATNYYLNNKIWEKIIPPDSRKNKILNRMAANAGAGLIDLLVTYKGVVFSIQWMHEEFHRNGLTMHGISSYDETYNRFNGGNANGSVSRVRDEDLIWLKKNHPQDLIRSFSAGIESEFLLLRKLQQQNFFHRTRYPNILLNILLTKHAVDYVNQFRQTDFDASIDSMNFYGVEISDRDYVGWDFSAWVYDLHRPHEAYEARGIHPNGNGINRAIKASALNADEHAYLTKMGRMQYLNFLSPFMLGINGIKISNALRVNFAVRHYLNSFGYDLNTDIMVSYKNRPILVGLHLYNNKDKTFSGLELSTEIENIRLGRMELNFSPTMMMWVQPDDLLFYDQKGKAGGLIGLKSKAKLNKSISGFIDLSAKTSGWVAGNPYMNPNFTLRSGLSFHFNQ